MPKSLLDFPKNHYHWGPYLWLLLLISVHSQTLAGISVCTGTVNLGWDKSKNANATTLTDQNIKKLGKMVNINPTFWVLPTRKMKIKNTNQHTNLTSTPTTAAQSFRLYFTLTIPRQLQRQLQHKPIAQNFELVCSNKCTRTTMGFVYFSHSRHNLVNQHSREYPICAF